MDNVFSTCFANLG